MVSRVNTHDVTPDLGQKRRVPLTKLGHSASASCLEIPLLVVRNDQKAFPIKIARDQPFKNLQNRSISIRIFVKNVAEWQIFFIKTFPSLV